jgi:hypothetical protein
MQIPRSASPLVLWATRPRGWRNVEFAYSGLQVLSFPHRLHLRYHNMSRTNLFAGAHHFVASKNTINAAKTVSGMFTEGCKLMTLDLLQINIHNNYGNRTIVDGVIPLMPNPSNRFTGRPEVISKLKRHFFNMNDSAQKRKSFLLYGMGGIGKTQICLKFVEEMSDW